jgi:ABC-2 type transport system permease protein
VVKALPTFRHTVRLIVVGGAISYRALFNWASPPMFVASLLGYPAMQMLFFVYLGRQTGAGDDHFYVVGNAVLAASAACVYGGTMALANERRFGTLGAVLLTPCGRIALWTGRALPYVLNGLLVMAWTLTLGTVLFGIGLTPADGLRLAPVLLAAAFSCTAFGLLLGALGLRFRDVFVIANLAALVLLLLTGTDVPRSALPAWLSAVGAGLPLTHAAAAARAVVGHTRAAGSPALTELLVGVAYAVAALAVMRYLETASRRHDAVDGV